ncbi:MAG: hypothetical protein JWO31_3663, partial [Phycisphaerales bacterium]|nr:hypothetical protein [Phycisphaerales bacterium]
MNAPSGDKTATGRNTGPHWRCRLAALAMLMAAGGQGAGCAQAVKQAAREAAPPAAKSAIVELAKPENQGTLNAVAEAPGVRRLGNAAGQGVGQGMLDYVFALVTGDATGADPQTPTTSPVATGASRPAAAAASAAARAGGSIRSS